MFNIGDRVKLSNTGREGTVEPGDRRASPVPSWARDCVMVRFDGSGDALTVPTSSLEKIN